MVSVPAPVADDHKGTERFVRLVQSGLNGYGEARRPGVAVRMIVTSWAAYYVAGLHPVSGSKSVIAAAASGVAFPRSFCSGTPSWLIMNVITPELPYSAG